MTMRPCVLATLLLGISGAALAQSQAAAAPASPSANVAAQQLQPAAAPATADPSAAKISPQSQLLLADADKLVDLAQQLKSEVDKTNQYTLSLNTLRRAEAVEKLAKDLQKQLQRSKK